MPPRIPTQSDFTTNLPFPLSLHFPSPPESTTTFLILLHGLGGHEVPFSRFAQNLNLPGVLAIAPRGVHPLPEALLPDGSSAAVPMSHWGDDLVVDTNTGELDEDPGFEKASKVVLDELVNGFLVKKFGWDVSDVLLFGFGQGGSLALGLAARLFQPSSRIVDVTDGQSTDNNEPRAFKGAVSIGGPLPQSLVSTVVARGKSRTSVLAVQLDEDAVEAVKREFADVRVVRWKRRGVVDMPRDREEALPLIKFFADRLNSSGPSLSF